MPKRLVGDRDDGEEAPRVAVLRADDADDNSNESPADQSPKRVQLCDDDVSSDVASDCDSSSSSSGDADDVIYDDAEDERDYDHDETVRDRCHNCEIEMAESDLGEFREVDGERWLLCDDCAVCCLCREYLNSDRPGVSSKYDENFIVVDHNGREGTTRRRFACGSMWMDEEVIGCGDRCAECGIVPAYEVPFLNEFDDDGWCDCVRHKHDCVVCGERRLGTELLQLYDGGLACPDKCAVWCDECLSAHSIESNCATERGQYVRRRGDIKPGEFRVSVFKLRRELREKLAAVDRAATTTSAPSSPLPASECCEQL